LRRSTRALTAALTAAIMATSLVACDKNSGNSSSPPQPATHVCPTDDNHWSWCSNNPDNQGSSAAAAVPAPQVDAGSPGRPPRIPGPEAPLPQGPGFCATKADPPDTGLHIDPIDDEVVATTLNSCAGGLQLAPKKFMLVLTIYWHTKNSTVWIPLVPPGQTTDVRIPYQYPAFTTTHAVAPCVPGASYFIKIQMPEGQNNLNYQGVPMPPIDTSGRQFDADGYCHTP